MIDTWSNVLSTSFQNIWFGVAGFVPNLVVAIIIFVVGWIAGSLIGHVVAQILRSLKLDQLLRSAGVEDLVKKTGHNLDVGRFIGTIVKWFIIIAFLVAAADALKLVGVTDFLQQVLDYLPRVVVAALVLIIGVVIADAMQKIVLAAARGAEVRSAALLGTLTKWAIWIFAIYTALEQLQINLGIIGLLLQGIVVALALAFGLAFGLGGQNAAAQTIEKIKGEISHKA